MISSPRAVAELVLAGAIWGFGFIAVKWALPVVGPIWLNALRFTAALLVMWPLVRPSHLEWKVGMRAGIFLSLTLVLQNIGLRYTSATKAGFITCLYVVWVPLFELMIWRRRMTLPQVLCLLGALGGMALISDLPSALRLGDWNLGDAIILLCSFTAAGQILELDRVASKVKRPAALHTSQILWGLLVAWPPALLLESKPLWPWATQAWLGVLMLSFASTVLAFLMQVRAQTVLRPLTASLLFLLEAPFAALFGFYFLDERLGLMQWLGALLILTSVIGIVLVPKRQQSA